MKLTVPLKKLNENATTPTYATFGDACFDLHACTEHPIIIPSGQQAIIPTGLAVAVPYGYRMDIYARSGNALKRGLNLGNSVGKIDAGYRGEVKVLLRNHGTSPVAIAHGERIAQAEINPVIEAVFHVQEELPQSDRGEGGFGHSGQ